MQAKDQEAHRAFCEYAEAKARVEQTMDFADALVAGRTWAKFLNAFLGPEDHLPTSSVIPFRRASK
jgi:hypothetical protein